MKESVFNTIEAEAWSRDFEWTDYTQLHRTSGCRSRMLMPDEWRAFKHMMELCMENDIGNQSSSQE